MFEIFMLLGHCAYLKAEKDATPKSPGKEGPPAISLFDFLPVSHHSYDEPHL